MFKRIENKIFKANGQHLVLSKINDVDWIKNNLGYYTNENMLNNGFCYSVSGSNPSCLWFKETAEETLFELCKTLAFENDNRETYPVTNNYTSGFTTCLISPHIVYVYWGKENTTIKESGDELLTKNISEEIRRLLSEGNAKQVGGCFSGIGYFEIPDPCFY